VILAIDPGNIESGYVLVNKDTLEPLEIGKIENEKLMWQMKRGESKAIKHVAIEKIASYGMPVGETTFDTCIWIGKFELVSELYLDTTPKYIYRKDEKMNLCHTMKAKDSNIIQALVDRFASCQKNYGKGTKKKPGWFYGFSRDIWQAYAVAVTYHDMYLKGDENEK
jgi:hypothetical protein